MIRELQELWLFGSLDTIADPADEQTNKAKALGIAAMVEALAKTKASLAAAGIDVDSAAAAEKNGER